jgi:hypothetical protein
MHCADRQSHLEILVVDSVQLKGKTGASIPEFPVTENNPDWSFSLRRPIIGPFLPASYRDMVNLFRALRTIAVCYFWLLTGY